MIAAWRYCSVLVAKITSFSFSLCESASSHRRQGPRRALNIDKRTWFYTALLGSNFLGLAPELRIQFNPATLLVHFPRCVGLESLEGVND